MMIEVGRKVVEKEEVILRAGVYLLEGHLLEQKLTLRRHLQHPTPMLPLQYLTLAGQWVLSEAQVDLENLPNHRQFDYAVQASRGVGQAWE